MNRQKAQLYFSVFAVTGAAAAVACGSITPYPQEDPLGTYPAGYQHPGSSGSAGGGTDGGGGCFATEAGTVCPEGGLPEAAPPPTCTGCIQVALAHNPQSIALDKTSIFWTDGTGDPWLMIPSSSPGSDSIMQAGRGGSASSAMVLVPGLSGPFIIKDQGSWLGWSNLSSSAGASSIDTFMVGATGAANTPGPGLMNAHGVALDATNVYWVSRGATGEASIESAPLAGGTASTLGMTATGLGFVPSGVAVNSTTLFFVGYEAATGGSGMLFAIPITGGVPNPIWSASVPGTKPVDVAVDGANVYWVDNGSGAGADGAVYSMPLAGGTVTTMASGVMAPVTIAVDSMNIYFTATDGIHEEAIGGTSPTLLVAIPDSVSVAADDTDNFVYFTHSGAILAHAK
jgi:hypothetical protein